jgi:hypothetical protein
VDSSTPGSIQAVHAYAADGTSSYVFPAATPGSVSYTATYVVTFLKGSGITAAAFKLAIYSSNFQAYNYYKIDYISVEANYFNSTAGYSVSNPTPVETLLKLTEILRNDIMKVFYVAPSSPNFNFTLFPITADASGNPTFGCYAYLYSIDGVSTGLSGNEWTLTYVSSTAPTGGVG